MNLNRRLLREFQRLVLPFLPELGRFGDEAESDRLRSAAIQDVQRRLGLALLAVMLPMMTLWTLVLVLVPMTPGVVPQPWLTIFNITPGVIGLFSFPIAAWLIRRPLRRSLRRRLRERGVILCLECGYDLHGLDEHPRCPECGERSETT